MGFFRTIRADLECAVCQESFNAEVQFKTGGDNQMETYNEGDYIASLTVGEPYFGCFDGMCSKCNLRHKIELNKACFDFLLRSMREGRLELFASTWERLPTGELSVIRGPAVSEGKVIDLSRKPQIDLYSLNYNQTLEFEWVEYGSRIRPDGEETSFFFDHEREFVQQHLLAEKLPAYGTLRDVEIIVDETHHAFLDRATIC